MGLDRFTEVVGLDRFAIYVFDYGAPTGFRLATWHPERVAAIISQNGRSSRGVPSIKSRADRITTVSEHMPSSHHANALPRR
jgi:pimeloyl-ACP methyl ester carboxylesterase